MNTQRVWIAALILLASLGAAACVGGGNQTSDGASIAQQPASEPPVAGNKNASPVAVKQPVGKADEVNKTNIALAKKQPFMLLITRSDCTNCDRLLAEMDKLRGENETRMLLFVLNVDDPNDKVSKDAKSLNVSLEGRKNYTPWAAVFEANGGSPKPPLEGEKDVKDFEPAVELLKAAVEEARHKLAPAASAAAPDGGNEEQNALVENQVRMRLGEIKAGLANDEQFRQSLLEDGKFTAGLAQKREFREALLADARFKNNSDWGVGTVLLYAAIGGAPLLVALGLGGLSFLKTRGAEQKVQQEEEKAAAWQSHSLRRMRVFRKALKSNQGVIPTLRSKIEGLQDQVREVVEGHGTLKVDVDADRASLNELKGVVDNLPKPQTFEGVIEQKLGELRTELTAELIRLELKIESSAGATPAQAVVTREELKAEIEKIDRELSDKISKGVSDVQADLLFDASRGPIVAPSEAQGPGHGLPAVSATQPQENGHDPQLSAEEFEGLKARLSGVEQSLENLSGIQQLLENLGGIEQRLGALEEVGKQPSPASQELSGEVASIRARQEEEERRRQSLESRLAQLEPQAAAASEQLPGLVAQMWALEKSIGERLAQQREDGELKRQLLEGKLDELKGVLEIGHLEVSEVMRASRATSRTVTETVRRLVNAQAAKVAAMLPADDEERANAAQSLEWYQKQLSEIAASVAPLAESMTELVGRAASTRQLPPGTNGELAEFLSDVQRFGRLERKAAERIESLRSSSARSRYQKFEREREELEHQSDNGDISPDQFANMSLALLDKYFADGANEAEAEPLAIVKEEVKDTVSRVEDRLMDWFSNFSRLHTQLQDARSSGAPVDEEVVQGTARALKVAREVLSRFDIQPEEILIGRTVYDRRLHDFVLTRQSSHPTHTIIEVRKSGFRRMRDGETIRRPQVVVAGTGAVSGTI
jgi:cell fate (sporulation/competence/biofilm development) regulator YlbF (YheA/YmcA/DUF963 family)